MTAKATLTEDGATRYETEDRQEFVGAIVAAREEGADITVLSEGNGVWVAVIRYPADGDAEDGADEPEGEPAGTDDPDAGTGTDAESTGDPEDLIGQTEPPAAPTKRTRKS